MPTIKVQRDGDLTTNFVHPELQVNLCQKLLFLQNMRKTCYVQKVFWMSETISVHHMFSPGLSLKFSCIELVIQWTIVVILWGIFFFCKNRSFWQRFTCTAHVLNSMSPTKVMCRVKKDATKNHHVSFSLDLKSVNLQYI